MIDTLFKSVLWIHIPFGFISLLLFWIPVITRKGSKTHKKVGKYYYISMWIVLGSAIILSIFNVFYKNYNQAIFLGYLSIITSYPLWYSHAILFEKKTWSSRYFLIRKMSTALIGLCGLALLLVGAIYLKGKGVGTVMIFFGVLGIPAFREWNYSKEKAQQKEKKLLMHIRGTITSGIAAHTAFLVFGSNQMLSQLIPVNLQFLPWILPTILGITYIRIISKKFIPQKT